MKVMTFNLRVVARRDGDNIFYNRRPRIIETVKLEKPDIIGFQEANDEMREFLYESLPEYSFFGCGREAELHGEGTPIAFLTEKFKQLEGENFWLSPTPEIPASRYENQSECPRVTSAVRLSGEGIEPFWFVNTHLDHISSAARVLGAAQLAKYIKRLGERVILTGDMNALPDTDEIAVLCSVLADATAAVGPTFHGFELIPPEKFRKIDYIFTDLPASNAYAVRDEHPNGLYISDHNPVCCDITVEK